MNRRELLLDAVDKAHQVHSQLRTREFVITNGGGIDVFGCINQLSIPLLFRPLDRLLGAYLPEPLNGIMITSERNLAIQRFTASHELGHQILRHKISLDDSSILNGRSYDDTFYSLDESTANIFAATFLIPEWLLEIHAERQGWNADSLDDPKIIYQLSLRIGASYEATCRQLYQYNLINWEQLKSHLSVPPKKIKRSLLEEYELPNWHPNVWELTQRDEGMLIQGGPNDVFLIRLKENSGAGYIWDFGDLEKSGFAVISDKVAVPSVDKEVGGIVEHKIIVASDEDLEIEGEISFKQLRPWNPSAIIESFNLNYELVKEMGLPRTMRRASVV